MTEGAAGAKTDTPLQTAFADLARRTVFTNPSVFGTDYIPEEIFVRREFQPVVRFYFDCLKFQLQQALVIVGPTGSGKTLAARYYGREAIRYAEQKDVSFRLAYLNCREIASPYVFWQQLLANLDAITPKGLSISDLIEKFARAVDGSRHLVLVIDEIEKMFTTLGGEKANDILYVLARLSGNRRLESAVSLILISNNVHLLDLLEPPVRSSLNVRTLTLGSYSALELVEILDDRATKGLKKAVCSEAMLNYIAARTAQFNSDARFAIRLLRNAAVDVEQRGSGRIAKASVDRACSATKTEIERDLLGRLGTSQLLILLAICKAARKVKDTPLKLRSVYQDIYRDLCEGFGRKPLVYSQFLSIVRGLQNYDLVNNTIERRRAGGFSRLVEVNFNPDYLESVAREAL